MIYILTILGCIAYIFIAGMFAVWLRMQFFSSVNERDFPYAVMERSLPMTVIDHMMALSWPLLIFIILAFYFADELFRRKNDSTRF